MNEACSDDVLFQVGSRVMAKRENVIARTAESDFVFSASWGGFDCDRSGLWDGDL